MKNLTILVLALLPFLGSSQTWFPEEAVYTTTSYVGIEKMEVLGSQEVEGKFYTVLDRRRIEIDNFLDTVITHFDKALLRTEGEKVIYNDGLGEQVLYDFGMEVGDSLKWVRISGYCEATFYLDSTFTKEINGVTVRVQEGRVASNYYYFFGTSVRIYEGVGVVEDSYEDNWSSNGYLIPQIGLTCLADDVRPDLCSFQNDAFTIGDPEECNILTPNLIPWFALAYPKWKLVFGSMSSPMIGHRNLRASGDTIIEGQSYTIIRNEITLLEGESDTTIIEEEPFYMREDTGRVYYWDDSEEHLIYDMTMRIGDTLRWRPFKMEEFPDEMCKTYFVLDSVQEVYGFFGKSIVQYGRVVQEAFDAVSIVQIKEGAGLTHFYNNTLDEWMLGGHPIPDIYFQCFFDGGRQVGNLCYWYGIFSSLGREDDCLALVSSVSPEPYEASLDIYPNPTFDQLRIHGDLSAVKEIRIIDASGKLILISPPSERLGLGQIMPGLYFLQAELSAGGVLVHKFIKQ